VVRGIKKTYDESLSHTCSQYNAKIVIRGIKTGSKNSNLKILKIQRKNSWYVVLKKS